MKSGTRIEFPGTPAMGGFPEVPAERAVIGRWTVKNGPHRDTIGPCVTTPAMGWHVVKFERGGCLIAHESRFRVIDNRE
jgi:hypothetical protein